MKTLLIFSFLVVQTSLLFSTDCATSYFSSGNRAFEQNNFKEAIVQYNLALQLDSTLYAARLARGMAYFASEQFDAAVIDFNTCVSLNATDKKAWLHRGLTKVALLDYFGALEDFEKCIELDPFDEQVYSYIADCKLILHGF